MAKQIKERGVEAVLEDMQLLIGPPEARYIQNVAIMMFCEHPEKFFGYTYVQMTAFPEGSVKNPNISEDYPDIIGSVPQMILATMERFRNLIIKAKVIKVPNQMESIRVFNYPYQAIEEAVVNSFYHRDYLSYEPVTIEIEPDCINIMSFPGIDRSISDKTIEEGKRFVSRYYRNRRLGEFLKELDLSEGHSTGVPTIRDELEKNGSPRAQFYTDEDRRAMRVCIPIHPAFLVDEEDDDMNLFQNETSFETKMKQVLKQKDYEKLRSIIMILSNQKTISIKEAMEVSGKSRTTVWRYMQILVEQKIVTAIGNTNNIVYKVNDEYM